MVGSGSGFFFSKVGSCSGFFSKVGSGSSKPNRIRNPYRRNPVFSGIRSNSWLYIELCYSDARQYLSFSLRQHCSYHPHHSCGHVFFNPAVQVQVGPSEHQTRIDRHHRYCQGVQIHECCDWPDSSVHHLAGTRHTYSGYISTVCAGQDGLCCLHCHRNASAVQFSVDKSSLSWCTAVTETTAEVRCDTEGKPQKVIFFSEGQALVAGPLRKELHFFVASLMQCKILQSVMPSYHAIHAAVSMLCPDYP